MLIIKKCECGYQANPLELEKKNTSLCPQCKGPIILMLGQARSGDWMSSRHPTHKNRVAGGCIRGAY